jgi:hypothetical protein
MRSGMDGAERVRATLDEGRLVDQLAIAVREAAAGLADQSQPAPKAHDRSGDREPMEQPGDVGRRSVETSRRGLLTLLELMQRKRAAFGG